MTKVTTAKQKHRSYEADKMRHGAEYVFWGDGQEPWKPRENFTHLLLREPQTQEKSFLWLQIRFDAQPHDGWGHHEHIRQLFTPKTKITFSRTEAFSKAGICTLVAGTPCWTNHSNVVFTFLSMWRPKIFGARGINLTRFSSSTPKSRSHWTYENENDARSSSQLATNAPSSSSYTFLAIESGL